MAKSSNIAKRLAKLKGKWKKAAKKKFNAGFGLGRHEAKLVGGDVGESQSKGRLQMHLEFVGLSGNAKGKHHHCWYGLETEDQMSFAINALRALGAKDKDLTNPEDIESVLKALLKKKPVVSLRVVESVTDKGTFTNTYIDKKGKKSKDEDEDEEEKELELGEGDKVKTPKGPGTVESLNEKKQTAKVKLKKGGKVITVKFADLDEA